MIPKCFEMWHSLVVRRSQLLTLILLPAAGLFLGLAGLELVVRAASRTSAAPVASDRPAYYYKFSSTESFQNPPFQEEKPAGTFRIVTIGDSFTFPHLLQLDDAYPARLQRMLNLNPGAARVEVLNWGVSGMSSIQEVQILQRALKTKPDLVLLQITLNDPQTTNLHKTMRSLGGGYTFGKLVISRDQTPLLYYWRTLGLLAERVHSIRTRQSFIRYNHELYKNGKLWAKFRAAIRSMRGDCERRGVKFAAFLVPFFHLPLDERYPFADIHSQIAGLMTRQHIRYLDLLPAFKGIDYLRLHVLPGEDSHPNEIAHRIIAEALYPWLESERLIPEHAYISQRLPRRFHRNQ